MGPWVSHSRPGLQLVTALGSTVVGLILVIGMRGFPAGGRNMFAGFALGVMLLVIGIAAAATSGPQTVTVDPNTRRIDVVDSYFIGTRKRSIPFSDIREVSIGYLGKASNYVKTYYLVLHLADGRKYPLFAPGRFFEGASDRSVVEGWRDRLQDDLGGRPSRS